MSNEGASKAGRSDVSRNKKKPARGPAFRSEDELGVSVEECLGVSAVRHAIVGAAAVAVREECAAGLGEEARAAVLGRIAVVDADDRSRSRRSGGNAVAD